ncbi:MAG: Gfo/Idh/MocA family oxidoreductase, partial [Armatimonadetes bacterium]|nr:Gfo/Idh/MocA family oxidoreductase [Armatimonadota bacterium]
GAEFGAARRYGSYEALAADPDVDAVYVASPHPMHKEDSLLCLNGGKAVLCEKPFTINAAEALQVIGTARARKLFLMEAMWTRFTPVMGKVRELVSQGAIGEVRIVQADFGFRAGFDPKSRLFDPALGGGALLDVGVYCISFASMLLGTPEQVVGTAHLGESGVDENTGILLRYPKGEIAVLAVAVRANTPQEATVIGTEGKIRIHAPFWIPRALTLSRSGQEDEFIELPYEGNGYNYEAQEVARCVGEGLMESPIMPLDETLAIMQTMDSLRAPWGLKYPTE